MQKYILHVPVANLRREPVVHKQLYEKDPIQESQAIFGEKFVGSHEKDGWVFVEAIEQKKWSSEKGWKGYPGWIQKHQLTAVDVFPEQTHWVDSLWQPIYEKPEAISSLKFTVPFGVGLTITDELSDHYVLALPDGKYGFTLKQGIRKREWKFCRRDICDKGKLFLGYPYLWGGRSAFLSNSGGNEYEITSVDCSGLTNLLYRINGVEIPRDAHDQFLRCEQKDYDELKAGDLIFSASIGRPERMTHVMLHMEPELLLESSMAPKCVRMVTMMEKFGVKGSGLKSGSQLGEEVVYFGSVV